MDAQRFTIGHTQGKAGARQQIAERGHIRKRDYAPMRPPFQGEFGLNQAVAQFKQ